MENLIKEACKILGITQKELAEKIGYGVDAVNRAVSTGEISNQMKKAIELLLENENFKNELKGYNLFKALLKNAVKEALK
jgi:transcriptional regulator with XRE-family HTH domain